MHSMICGLAGLLAPLRKSSQGRGSPAAFSLEHAFLASVCGIVSAAVAVALLAQMDRTIDSAARQATISAMATFIGDVFAHSSHFPPQWAEPTVTAAVSGGIAIALWYAKRWAKSL
jgi:hypothetical protein